MDASHDPGCDRRHTPRQVCNENVLARGGSKPKERTLSAPLPKASGPARAAPPTKGSEPPPPAIAATTNIVLSFTLREILARWPRFSSLVDGYLDRLASSPVNEARKSWFYRAAEASVKRREPAAYFDALESASCSCDGRATGVLTEKFTQLLPRTPRDHSHQDDERVFDVMVELAAYAWLRQEFPTADAVEFLEESAAKSADLRMKLNDRDYRIEAKNIHQSRDIAAALRAGQMVVGSGGIKQGFLRKLQATTTRARDQLEGVWDKIIFINYTPDPDLWVMEDSQLDEIATSFREAAPGDALLVVFRNYNWAQPFLKFEPTSQATR